MVAAESALLPVAVTRGTVAVLASSEGFEAEEEAGEWGLRSSRPLVPWQAEAVSQGPLAQAVDCPSHFVGNAIWRPNQCAQSRRECNVGRVGARYSPGVPLLSYVALLR